MSRALVITLYAALVVIWSSTWVAIKIGLEDTPVLLGAGIRFALAGAGLVLVAAALRRPLRTDLKLAVILAVLPFAISYALVYWGEQYIPSGLAAVLFGVMPLYVAALSTVYLKSERITLRRLAGIAIAVAGLAVAFSESLSLGHDERALLGAGALLAAPFAAAMGNIAIKLRAAELDPVVLNGWAMLAGGLASACRLGGVGELGRRDLEHRRDPRDRVARDLRIGARVRRADDPAARAPGSDDVVHPVAAAVRRAAARLGALRRGDHAAGAGGRGTGRRRPARCAVAGALTAGDGASRRERARSRACVAAGEQLRPRGRRRTRSAPRRA